MPKHTDDSLIQSSELPGNTYQHSISHSERIDVLPQESLLNLFPQNR